MKLKKLNILITLFLLLQCVLTAQQDYYSSSYYPSSVDLQLLNEIEKGDTSTIKKILFRGAKINSITTEGVTPLMYAVLFDRKDVVELLLYYGADMNIKAYDGKTALIMASEQDLVEIGEMLILNKADLIIQDNQGFSALHYAIINERYYFADMMLYYEADVNEKAKDGSSPLSLASYIGNIDIAEMLVSSGADINSQDKKGYTPLMISIQNGNTEIVEILLNKGAETEVKNNYGQTAITYAVINGNKDILELLINYGANYQITFYHDYNLLYLADQYNQFEIKNYLQDLGLENSDNYHFNKFGIRTGVNFSGRDAMFQVSTGIEESKLKLNVDLVYMKRFGYVPVIEFENNYILQIQENRSYFGFNVDKEFEIIRVTNLTNIGVVLSVKEMFSYGKLKGIKRNPWGGFVFSPGIGFYYRKGGLITMCQYQYLSPHIEHFSTSRVSLTIGFDFSFRKEIIKEKEYKIFNWYDEN